MNTAQRSFAKGEVAPAFYARTDVAAYSTALRTCRNMQVMKTGGVTKRRGTLFVGEIADSDRQARLIPFIYSVSQSLALEFGHLTIRFVINAAYVADPVDDTIPYEIASPYIESDLADLQYVQSGDVITIVHPSYAPAELKRLANNNWTLTTIAFGPTIGTPVNLVLDGGATPGFIPPTTLYKITAISAANGEESLPSDVGTRNRLPTTDAPITITWDAVPGASSYVIYRYNRYSVVTIAGGGGQWGVIGTANLNVFTDNNTTQPDTFYQPPVFNNVFASAGNYPSVVAYYQQRLVFANTINEPQKVWMSQTGNFHNFNTQQVDGDGIASPIQDDDAVVFTLVSDEVDAVRHVVNLGRLLIGTEGPEWIVEGDANGAVTPTAVNSRIGSYNGMSKLRPIKADSHLIFVQALGALVRDLQSNIQFGYYSFQGSDASVFSSHLLQGQSIVDWAWQQEPNNIVWMVRSDGVLLGMTYLPEQQLVAWHRHDTDGTVENVCVIPEGDETAREHRVYLIVRRLIDGVHRRYVERMTEF